MKYLVVGIILVVTNEFLFAQKPEYFTKHGEATAEDSSYFYLIGNTVNGLYEDTVKLYYTSSRKLMGKQKYKNGYLNGFFTFFHENGKIMSKGISVNGRPVGYVIDWYATGKPKQTLYFPEERGKISEYIDQDYLIINYWDSLGNQLVKNSEGMCECNFGELVQFTTESYNPVDGAFKPLINYSFRDLNNEFRLVGRVKDGLKDSLWIAYKTGVEFYRDTYSAGILQNGISTDSNGIQYKYNVISESPLPKGGYPAFYKFVAQKMEYPVTARKKGIEGKVFVEFVIDSEGSVTDVKALISPDDSLGKEAVRIVKTSPKWRPAIYRGKPSKYKMIMPITFKLG